MTEIFLDTTDIEEIKKFISWGIGTGVTTNQSIFLKKSKGKNFKEEAKKILELVRPYPVSLEGPNDLEELLDKAEVYNTWGNNVVIKVPMMGNGDGLKAVSLFKGMNIRTNVTACMSVNQAFLAANAGATYVSLFFNRIKDIVGEDNAVKVLKRTMKMLENYDTKLIVGSIRHPDDIPVILDSNPHIITIPSGILDKMPWHDRTESTLKEFEKCWEEFCKAEKC